MSNDVNAPTVVIMGRAGTGKTALATLIANKLKEVDVECTVVDDAYPGDFATRQPDYCLQSAAQMLHNGPIIVRTEQEHALKAKGADHADGN